MSYRSEIAAEMREMRARGEPVAEIAAVLGYAENTVWAYLDDPAGSKDRARKDSYRGVCENCGAATTGCNGRDKAPRLCLACSRTAQAVTKYWTRERVLDAIRRFAAAHGRPPKATEWVRSDPDNDYPSFGSVYRGRGHENNPFASWAEAVEAAGFERPGAGYYERTPEILRRQSEAQRRRWARRRTAA